MGKGPTANAIIFIRYIFIYLYRVELLSVMSVPVGVVVAFVIVIVVVVVVVAALAHIIALADVATNVIAISGLLLLFYCC